MACASTVAVVVPSPAVSDVLLATSRTICAPMFSSGSFRSISFATVTPSLVMVGEPYFLSRTTLRPLGPSVTFTASASWLTPRRIACRDCSPNTICFAMALISIPGEHGRTGVSPARARAEPRSALLPLLGSAFDHGKHFVLAHDEVLVAVDLDFLTRVLAEQDGIAGLDIERNALAVI